METVSVIKAQFAQVLGEILSMQDELQSVGLTVTGSRGQPMPNRLISEVRAHRFLLLQIAALLRHADPSGDVPVPSEDEIDRLRKEWEEGL